jgi:hypothetical protein
MNQLRSLHNKEDHPARLKFEVKATKDSNAYRVKDQPMKH